MEELISEYNPKSSTPISFSRFGRNLEKTHFRAQQTSTQGLIVQVYMQPKVSASLGKQNFYKYSNRPLTQNSVTCSWLFRKIGRDQGPYYKGINPHDSTVEPKYTPKFDALYSHTPQCFIKTKHRSNVVTPDLSSQLQSSTLNVESSFIGKEGSRHVPSPTPLNLQTPRQPLIRKALNMSLELSYNPPPQENKSHSFTSYQPHYPITNKVAMPDYELERSWQQTLPAKKLILDFSKQVSRVDEQNQARLLEYNHQEQFYKLSHVKRASTIDFKRTPSRKEKDVRLLIRTSKQKQKNPEPKLYLYGIQENGKFNFFQT